MSGTITAAVIIGAGTVGAAYLQSEAARDAAAAGGDAQMFAVAEMARAGAQARSDNILLTATGMADYAEGVETSIQAILQGQSDTEAILHQTTDNANLILTQSSENAQRALLGLPPAGSPGDSDFGGVTGDGTAAGSQYIQDHIYGTFPPGGAYPGSNEQYQDTSAEPMYSIVPGGSGQWVDENNQPVPEGTPGARPVNEYTTETLNLLDSGILNPTLPTSSLTGIDPRNIDPLAPAPALTGMPGSGLIAARGDIEAGATRAQGQIEAGNARAQEQLELGRGALTDAELQSMGLLYSAKNEALGALGYTGPGGGGSGNRYLSGVGGGGGLSGGGAEAFTRSAVPGAALSALAGIDKYAQRAVGELEVFASHGEAAMREASALSGAMGAEAQQRAINGFIESPGQTFMRERQEQALLRNQAAIGGLGGGNVRTALQEQAVDIASTQQQQQIQNLLAIAAQGQQSAAGQGSFWSAAGGQTADVMGGVARQQISTAGGIASSRIAAQASLKAQAMALEAQREGRIADIISASGVNMANVSANTGLNLSGMYQEGANIEEQGGINLANIDAQSGVNLSNLATQSGINLANIISGTAAAQAGLTTDLGTNVGNLWNQSSNQVADLYESLGLNMLNTRTNLGSTLGNIAVGSGTGIANLTAAAGEYDAAGIIGQSNAWANGISGLAELLGGAIQNPATATPITPTQDDYNYRDQQP